MNRPRDWDATISFGLKLLALLCGATGLVLVWMGIFATIIGSCQ